MTLNNHNHCADGEDVDLNEESASTDNIPPIVPYTNLLARGAVVRKLVPDKTEHQQNKRWKEGMIIALKGALGEMYRLTDPEMTAMRNTGDDIVSRQYIDSLHKMVISHRVSGNGVNEKVHAVRRPMDIQHKLANSKNMDPQRLSTKKKVKKNTMKRRVKKRVYLKGKRAKQTIPTLPKNVEDMQRKEILGEKERLQNLLKDDKEHKEYAPTKKVTTTGPRRSSKRLRDKRGDIVPPNKRMKY